MQDIPAIPLIMRNMKEDKKKIFNTVYRSIVVRITNNETGEVEFVPLYSWTEKKKENEN